MRMLRTIASCRPVRALVIPFFRRINLGDITIHHQWTGEPLILHSFKHKGYWFHGKQRELRSMQSISRLVRPGDVALDIGGHIGYVALYLGHLVGPSGQVHVFEPGPNNLHYIHRNIRTSKYLNINLLESAVGRSNGVVRFWTEDLTGQNNSTIQDYRILAENIKSHNTRPHVVETQVPCVTVDSFVASEALRPDFIKVDVEGAELDVLMGMPGTLRDVRPILLIEVTHRHADVLDVLKQAEYGVCDEELLPMQDACHTDGNVFALPMERIGQINAPREAASQGCP